MYEKKGRSLRDYNFILLLELSIVKTNNLFSFGRCVLFCHTSNIIYELHTIDSNSKHL